MLLKDKGKEMYDQKIVGLVIAIKKRPNDIIKQMVEFIKNIDVDDQIYLPHTGIIDYKSKSIPELSRYPYKKLLEDLLEVTVKDLTKTGRKYIVYVISDRLVTSNKMKKLFDQLDCFYTHEVQDNCEVGLFNKMLIDYGRQNDTDEIE